MGIQLNQQNIQSNSVFERMTPEEEAKSNGFFSWLKETACELNLDEDEQAERKKLYNTVLCLRPHYSLEAIRTVQGSVTQWAISHPADPLNSVLQENVEVRMQEAQLWDDLNINFSEF